MEKFPNIQPGQFVVLFLNKNTGHVYDIDLKIYDDNTADQQKAYAVLNSLDEAKDYADQKIQADTQSHLDFGYLIYDHNHIVIVNKDHNL